MTAIDARCEKLYKKLINKMSCSMQVNIEIPKSAFIRTETILTEKPISSIDSYLNDLLSQNGDDLFKLSQFFSQLERLQEVEWLTICNTDVAMINFNIQSKIFLTAKSNFEAWFSSFTAFNHKKADCSIDIFANSSSHFNCCYFHHCKSSSVIIHDFAWATFKNCIFDGNNISVFISNNSFAEFDNCLFLDDKSITIFASKNAKVNIKNCQFKNVTKAIFAKDNSAVRIDDTVFIDCIKGAATFTGKSTLMIKNSTISNSSSAAVRIIGSIIRAQDVSIINTKGNAISIENASGYFYNCRLNNNTEYPTISVRGLKSNPLFEKCEVRENGETFAVVIKNCARPLFDNCLFTDCQTNCFSISDFSMPLLENCHFNNIKKYYINVFGRSIVTLIEDYNKDKINLSKNSKRWNKEQLKQEEKNYIIDENKEESETICRSWRPSDYKDTPEINILNDPEEMTQKNLAPLPLIDENKLNTEEDKGYIFKSCSNSHDNNQHEEKEELYISAQCGHCICKDCWDEGHSICLCCDTPIKSLKKVYKVEQCVICYEKATTVIISCGHMCLCYKCANKFAEQNFKCPLCCQPIISYRYIFDE